MKTVASKAPTTTSSVPSNKPCCGGGSGDLDDLAAYSAFIPEIVGRHNARHRARIDAERAVFGPLPAPRTSSWSESRSARTQASPCARCSTCAASRWPWRVPSVAPSPEQAKEAYNQFCEAWATKYLKAVACLRKDEQSLFSFYAFPAAHWVHLRTSNPIESTYATVRLRTKRTKGCGSRTATLTIVWKLALEAEKTWWCRLTGFKLIRLVMAGARIRRRRADGGSCLA